MKCSRKSVRTKENAIPQLRFEDQRLTSFAGLVVLQKFFQIIGLKGQLQKCFRHRALGKVFDRTTIFMQLIIHLLLGFRELRDCDHYRDDPMVQRLLGLKRLPDVATLSRMLKEADEKSVVKLRQLLADMVLDRIASLSTNTCANLVSISPGAIALTLMPTPPSSMASVFVIEITAALVIP